MTSCVYAEEEEEQTFTFDSVSAMLAGTLGAVILVVGLGVCLYDYKCRNYAAELPPGRDA